MDMVLEHYFKYKIKKFVGYAKVAEQSNVKFLTKCKTCGFTFIKSTSEYVFFKIDNKLYRQLKLYHLGNQPSSYKIKVLDFLVDISEKSDQNEVVDAYSNYWCSGKYYDYYEDEKSLQRAEYKERLRNQNKLYNQKYKLKR